MFCARGAGTQKKNKLVRVSMAVAYIDHLDKMSTYGLSTRVCAFCLSSFATEVDITVVLLIVLAFKLPRQRDAARPYNHSYVPYFDSTQLFT